jgi:hypothetical protein
MQIIKNNKANYPFMKWNVACCLSRKNETKANAIIR